MSVPWYRRGELKPHQIKPLVWLFPLLSAVLGGVLVTQQTFRERSLRAELIHVSAESARLEAHLKLDPKETFGHTH